MGDERWDQERVLEFWAQQASEHAQSPAASWSDLRVIELEIQTIGSHLAPGSRVLDVGCANGHSSARYALEHGVVLTGIDNVAEMIANANERREALPKDVRERLDFSVGDVRRLEFPDESFDVVVSTRVVINLREWEAQRQALHECARVLRPGGLLLLSEASVQGWRRLNALRREWGLDDIPMPPFNTYLDEEHVIEELGDTFDLEELVNFASSYYVATRWLKPLLARAAAPDVDVSDPGSELNRWAAQLPPSGDYGTQKLFILRKR